MRAGDDAQLTRAGVGAGDRDAGREAAATVRVHAERAVLVPRNVGDALDHTDRLDERLDAVAGLVRELVVVVGERADAPVTLGVEQFARARRVRVEGLHAHAAVVAGGGAGPPRPAVAPLVRRAARRPCRRLISSMASGRTSRAGGGTRPRRGSARCRRSSSSGPNERCRSSGAPSRSWNSTAPRVCTGRASIERAQHDPPVEEVAEVAARHVEPAAGQERHRRLEVVDDVGDVVVGEPHDCRAVGTGGDGERVAGQRERPLARGCDDGERLTPELARAGAAYCALRRDELRELLVEELARVDGAMSSSVRVRKSSETIARL